MDMQTFLRYVAFLLAMAWEGDALSSRLFNFASEYAIRKIKANHKLLQFNSTHQVIIYADDVNLSGQTIHIINLWGQRRQTISFNSRSRCWESWKYVSVPRTASSTKSQYINTCNKSFGSVGKVHIFVNNPNISKLHSGRNQQQQNALWYRIICFAGCYPKM
jgi:hypothetical protein